MEIRRHWSEAYIVQSGRIHCRRDNGKFDPAFNTLFVSDGPQCPVYSVVAIEGKAYGDIPPARPVVVPGRNWQYNLLF